MNGWKLASAALFNLAALVTIVAILTPPPPQPGEHEPWLVHTIEPGRSLDFLLSPQHDQVKVVSLVLPGEGADDLPLDWLEYGLEAAWLDPEGQEVHTAHLVERTRPSWFPGTEEVYRRDYLTADPQPVTDGRATLLPASSLLPRGGNLRLSAPEDGPTLLVRTFGRVQASWVESGQRALGTTAKARQGYLLRVGMPHWELLNRGERLALTRTAWETLRPAADTTSHPRWLMHASEAIPPSVQQAAGMTLAPHRSMAVDLVGPVSVQLSGGPGLFDLHIEATGAQGPTEVQVRPGRLVGLMDETQSRGTLVLDQEGPVSLVLHNPTDQPVGPVYLSMDELRPEHLHGWTAAADLAELLPGQGVQGALLGPEWRYLTTWQVDADHTLALESEWLEHGDPIQLEVRTVLEGPEDTRPRTLGLQVWTPTGEVRAAQTQVPSVPAPFELGLPGRTWLSEPETLYLLRDQGVRRVVLHSEEPLLVMARTRGAPRGAPELYPLPEDLLARLRYRRDPVTPWHPLLPEGGAQAVRVAANVRLELPPAPSVDQALSTQPWTSLEPASRHHRDRQRVWLVPVDDQAPVGTLYCAHGPGTSSATWSAAAADALEGELSGVLWSSRLGQPWAVELDQAPWRQGRVRQRVTRLRSLHEPPHQRLSLQGGPGDLLWLRTHGLAGPSCAQASRPFELVPVDPGASITWAVYRGREPARVLVGGTAPSEATLRVLVDEGSVERVVGLHPTYSEPVREWTLPLDERRATPLDDPSVSLGVLDSRALVLGTDLPEGWHQVRVENLGTERVHLRAAAQGGRGQAEEPEAERLRGGGP